MDPDPNQQKSALGVKRFPRWTVPGTTDTLPHFPTHARASLKRAEGGARVRSRGTRRAVRIMCSPRAESRLQGAADLWRLAGGEAARVCSSVIGGNTLENHRDVSFRKGGSLLCRLLFVTVLFVRRFGANNCALPCARCFLFRAEFHVPKSWLNFPAEKMRGEVLCALSFLTSAVSCKQQT